uniref:Cytochrome P450 monooxygenase CYP4EY1 n=1 Tax=Apolygus lucorum TaxID=248454 RepID=A0A2U7QTF3_APOLU|nr:cytochrome P450 monooxygenase CYP4EY1 [Apolygus lucorum]
MIEVIPILVAVAVCYFFYLMTYAQSSIPRWRTIKMFNKLPGPEAPFFVGAAFELMRLELHDILSWMKERFDAHGGSYALWMMGNPIYLTADPEVAEVILTSTKNINKGTDYQSLEHWLHDGLLLSTGEKWKQRRKMLTPSFHFKILDNSTDCMNKNWKKVVHKFLESKGVVEPLPIMGRGALDIICETAMGTELGETDERSKEYVRAVKRANEVSVVRMLSPFMRSSLLFSFTSMSRQHNKDVQILHEFTEKVITKRREEFEDEKRVEASEYSEADEKKRQVFLDSLLELSEKENMSSTDIREEVDTFMFAGHDTTSTGLQYLLMHLGENPEVQEKAYQEQVEIFGYSDRDVTKDDLSKMHYLDQVIKESMRLHPPAPQIARELSEDAPLPNGLVIPSQTKIVLNIFNLHRNPKYWSDPDAFKPERFSLEESKNRHPYSYIPFSAGPRNCIGQKFAMLEMKIGASTILRSCKISSVTKSSDLKYKMLIVLQPSTPIKVEISPRN